METASRDALELQGKRKSVNKLSVHKQRNRNSGKTKPKPPPKPPVQLKCYSCGCDHKTRTCLAQT